MRAHVLGCRGSTPATGTDFTRFGGDTSAVAVSSADAAPTLVLDAGTGLRRLGDTLEGDPFQGAIVLTHLHWDHTHGLPFTAALDQPGAEVDLFLPEQGVDPEELLARAMGPPHFPVYPSQLRGRWRFHTLEPGTHHIAGFAVTATQIPHKGGRTYAYRIEGQAILGYAPDHAPGPPGSGPLGLGPVHDAIRSVADGVDLLLHDAQYLADEYPHRARFGHSAVEYAIDLGERAGARRTMLFHHDPDRTDAQILSWDVGAALVAAAGAVVEV